MIINTLKQRRRSFYFAHRGAPWVEKENSIMSFCRAIELGCQGLEMDLQITKDKKMAAIKLPFNIKMFELEIIS